MGVEDALQTNETVDIFQEESLIRNFGVREANGSSDSQMFTELSDGLRLTLLQDGCLRDVLRGQLMFGLRSIEYIQIPRFAHLGEEEAGAITKTHSKLKDPPRNDSKWPKVELVRTPALLGCWKAHQQYLDVFRRCYKRKHAHCTSLGLHIGTQECSCLTGESPG